jgi:hypothetical protein
MSMAEQEEDDRGDPPSEWHVWCPVHGGWSDDGCEACRKAADEDDMPERDYLQEARTILDGGPFQRILPETRHLEALEEAHQSEILKIVHELSQLMAAVLKRN